MKTRHRLLAVAVASTLLASCSDSLASNETAFTEAMLLGRWEKREQTLPPVALDVRREGSSTVGQVWLSGVTYTLPAVLDDSSVVLANPASSALAPFVGVLQKDGTMRATLRGQPDYIATLHRVP